MGQGMIGGDESDESLNLNPRDPSSTKLIDHFLKVVYDDSSRMLFAVLFLQFKIAASSLQSPN